MTDGESPEDAELAARIASLDVIEPPPGWVDRAVDRWEKQRAQSAAPRPPRRRWWPVAAAGVVVAMAAAVVLVSRCGARHPDALVVAVTHDGPRDRAGEPSVGDTLSAAARGRHAELRLYLDERLVARCPDGPGCVRDGAQLRMSHRFDRPGRYQVVALWAPNVPTPTAEGLALDLLRASEVGARVEREPVIDVR